MADTRYSRLEKQSFGEHDLDYEPSSSLRKYSNHLRSPWLVATMAFFAGALAAFGALRLQEAGDVLDIGLLKPIGDTKVQFMYNETYPGPPTMESEWAWLDLFPDGLGAVQHDSLDDGIVTISVFHQLHCLMILRHVAYKDWNETRHSIVDKSHWGHCFEYLRQSIMCNADTNVEHRIIEQDGLKTTPGWNVHRCRDFDTTLKWAQEWRAYDGKIPSQMREITDLEGLHGRVIEY